MLSLFVFVVLLAAVRATSAGGGPDKIYGVNLGSWLLLEPWMLPQGGRHHTCIAPLVEISDSAFAQAYPDTVDQIFDGHWSTWFTQEHVDQLSDFGINTVRVPLGYWIVEPLVDRQTEFYPRGGLRQLASVIVWLGDPLPDCPFQRRGLQQLKTAGIHVILDHHALPGVQTAGQQFAGRCTSDVQFYTDANYHRALVWTAVMTALSHLDPTFGSVFSIQAVNEPIMDANQTPGYGDFQKNFVRVVRAMELALGVSVPGTSHFSVSGSANFTIAITSAVNTASTNIFTPEVKSVLEQSVPILLSVGHDLGILSIFDFGQEKAPKLNSREALVTNFMDINWQHNNPANPADAAIGPQAYDNHLYYSFGGVADANPTAYMTSICNLKRVQNDAAVGNTPLWFGEWALPTQFSATDDFLYQWADAQKLAYSQGRGWIFWNFRVETSAKAGDLGRQWSYLEGVRRGYLTKDPSKLNNPHVCDAYTNNTTPSN
ncbi:hypothetical protein NLI96_g3230 [Meripilus lineatus]|uniref:Glycoside hydrolase family 5 protein n=1 Tax=Meripilus lineatus TaxID=2056292 RepID=A0AAD5V7B8_9APHY|nr:hypothetical protein NLI96_g3230 [Physisporinus lineatus]